jgi:alpha-L-rhamnosidase
MVFVWRSPARSAPNGKSVANFIRLNNHALMRNKVPLSITLLSLAFALNAFAGFGVKQLRCEYLENPLGIDAAQPRLSWILEAGGRGEEQTAYQILVASSAAELNHDHGDLWDSGKVASDETTFVAYSGKPLMSRQACFWKVRGWDQGGKVSPWSEVARWEMGLLASADWQAQWIARTTNIDELPAPYFRHELTLDGKIKTARVCICGLGYYELHINGQKVGDHLLDPGYTRYDRRDLYVTHDVTALLKRGPNAVGVILGNGWFNPQTKAVWNFHEAPWREAPKLLLSLVIEYTDGRTMVIGSDGTWKTATGPIGFDSIYGGENYDARLEIPGWDKPGFDDSTWQPAQIVSAPKGKLVAQMAPPIKADQVIKPIKLTEPKPGVFVFDMGQNFAGVTELNVRGPAGTTVTLRHGERLSPDGSLDTRDIAQHVKRMGKDQSYQTDNYTLKGGGTETWRARFTYYGFQYVEVTGFPGRPTLDSVRGIFTHSAVPVAGEFECSNLLLNKIWRATRWAYLSNLQGIPTDCPHREKNGWTGDAHLAAEQAIYNFMPAGVYTKWINDLGDEQKPSGQLPGIVPTSGWGYTWGNGPAWDSAFELIPFYLYEYYGDTQPLRYHYDGLKRYVDYLTSRATNGIVNIGLNDWAPFKTQTPADITDTAYYYRDTKIVALAASLLGKTDDAAKYNQLAEQIKKTFNAHFFNADAGTYGNGSQTSLSCALYQGLVEPENQARVLQNLVASVERKNGHIDTGILGAKYILNALTDHGRADVAYRMASQKDLPSWGWWIEQGATTLWEQWNGSESRNHIMFGDISAWFYKALAGINADPAVPGFKHIIIRPQPVGDLTSARAEYDSIHGKIVSDWKIAKGKFNLQVVIPPNTTVTIYMPNAILADVREGRRPAIKADGVTSFSQAANAAIFEVGSGEYHFTSPCKPAAGF